MLSEMLKLLELLLLLLVLVLMKRIHHPALAGAHQESSVGTAANLRSIL
jgi:hypothetical protein